MTLTFQIKEHSKQTTRFHGRSVKNHGGQAFGAFLASSLIQARDTWTGIYYEYAQRPLAPKAIAGMAARAGVRKLGVEGPFLIVSVSISMHTSTYVSIPICIYITNSIAMYIHIFLSVHLSVYLASYLPI